MTSICSKTVLTSLTVAALALPGMALANGVAPSAGPTGSGEPTAWYADVATDFKYTRYHEGDSKRYNRYKIDVWQAHLVVPIKEYTLSLYAQRDSQSGASAQYFAPYFTRNLAPPWNFIDSVSGATIQSDRNQVEMQLAYAVPGAQYGVKLYYSSEEDNQSPGVSLLGQWNFNKNNTTLWAETGVGRSNNRPIKSGSAALSRVPNAPYRYNTAFDVFKNYIALKQDLSKYNYAVLSLEFDYMDGNMSDTYRFTAVGGDARFLPTPSVYYPPGSFPPQYVPNGATVPTEKRPNHRAIWLPMIRFVQAIPASGGAVHLDYRYGRDDWSIKSHMFEGALYQPFGGGWEIVPKIRYYSQSRAKFFAPGFQVNPGDFIAPIPVPIINSKGYSSDYRLSGYGTMNYELRLGYDFFKQAKLAVLAGYYLRSASYKMGKKDPWVQPETKGKNRAAKYLSVELNMKL